MAFKSAQTSLCIDQCFFFSYRKPVGVNNIMNNLSPVQSPMMKSFYRYSIGNYLRITSGVLDRLPNSTTEHRLLCYLIHIWETLLQTIYQTIYYNIGDYFINLPAVFWPPILYSECIYFPIAILTQILLPDPDVAFWYLQLQWIYIYPVLLFMKC